MPRVQVGRQRPTILQLVRAYGLDVTTDVLVIANAIELGLEVDSSSSENFQILRILLCLAYITEFLVRCGIALRRATCGFPQPRMVFEFSLILCASTCVLLMDGKPAILWRITILRTFRLVRIGNMASEMLALKDLWLILVGFQRSLGGVAWFSFVVFIISFSCAGAAMGLARQTGRAGSLTACEPEPNKWGSCVDLESYFGSVPKSAFTVLQIITIDRWAKLVRSISPETPLAGIFLTVVLLISAYGFGSILVGILVEKMLKLARSHGMHTSQKRLTEDKQTVATLGAFLAANLHLDGRSALRVRDIRDSLQTNAVKRAFDGLELPLQVPDELWHYLDSQIRKTGEMSVEEFTNGVLALVKRSTPTDVCALTARLGGSVTYITRMGRRTADLRSDLEDLRSLLHTSYEELAKLADPNVKGGQMAEVGLRMSRAIANRDLPGPPRYTR